MKWKNKGHEIEEYASLLKSRFEENKKIFIFGAGILGKELYWLLKKFDCFGAFIDNSEIKQEKGYIGEQVISLKSYYEHYRGCWIVVASSHTNIKSISKQISEYGLVINEDYFYHEQFKNKIFPIISTYCYEKSFVGLTQISLTERCTLKCKNCAHACYAVKNTSKDMTLESVCQSADAFFEKVDCIHEFVLIGGEPLLYNDLTKVISYIGKKYRDRMIIYSITTNGTIMPTEEIIKECKKYDVLFRISNYSYQVPRLRKYYEKLTDMLNENQITYVLGKEEHEWVDYGFGSVNRENEEKELINIFDACNTSCHEIRGNKFYYCVMARSVAENLHYNVGQDDYLDMDELSGDNYKKILLEFLLGYSSKGYLDMCNYCNGAEAINYPIPAAEQVK